MKEESKGGAVPFRTSGQTLSEQEAQVKARLNSNLHYQRAQKAVFRNVASIDKLIAYSISTPGCPSLARVK